MRAAIPTGDYRGRHQRMVLARFRPTWSQALARGVRRALPVAVILAVVGLVAWTLPAVRATAGRTPFPEPGTIALVVVGALPAGVLLVALLHRRAGADLDGGGVVPRPRRAGAPVSWREVVDVRAERHRGRTLVVLDLRDNSTRRLAAPYDGDRFRRDPRFEQKLFLIRHLWTTHRDWRARG